MTLWGTVARTETLRESRFACPHCERQRVYSHVRVATYFAVLGFDIYQNGILADYILCQTCEREFAPNGVDVTQTSLVTL